MEDNKDPGIPKLTELHHYADLNHKEMTPTLKPELCKGDVIIKDVSKSDFTPANPLMDIDDIMPQISIDDDPSIEENKVEMNKIVLKKFSNTSPTTEKRTPPIETQASENLPTEYAFLATEKSERIMNEEIIPLPVIRTMRLDSTTVARPSKKSRTTKRLVGSITRINFKTIFRKQVENQNLLSDVEFQLLNDKTCSINSLPKYSKIKKHRAHVHHYFVRLKDALQKHGILKKKNHHKELVKQILTTVQSNKKPTYRIIKSKIHNLSIIY